MRRVVCLSLFFFSHAFALTVKHDLGETEIPNIPQRVVALDWVSTETLLSLGITPFAIADTDGYRHWVAFPALPDTVKDVGSRREPNLESITALKPDLIVINEAHAAVYPALAKIAPTVAFNVFNGEKKPLKALRAMTVTVGSIFGKEDVSHDVINATQHIFQQNNARLHEAGMANLPLVVIRFIGNTHVRIHGEGSLANDIVAELGLRNSWQEKTNNWGFSSSGIDTLAKHQQATVVYLEPLDDAQRKAIFSTPFWKAMRFNRENNVIALPPIWTFGGLLSAQRMSNEITANLIGNAEK
ncbi:ABC transporter substrate-binding protein [Grimontia hollisae]|uniref:ABC transporter substrate-binding protein n=1 Tax=Grimontia hollisae TaxID=673 RepID=UPI001303ABDE|nr:iron-siderophore ABC transporter substrate-binding protein [Grimontia hollisae]